ncbi:MAG: Lrp/AsnC family transcriptional regulator [Sneathiella sp.]|nr:Lrp/AsnC family transcriptional regulator [Sneathiella sp.]
MDLLDRKILNLLQEDSRRSYASIGREVGVSVTAVKDRIDRLVKKGILKNFTINIDAVKVGYGVLAFIFVGFEKSEDCQTFETNVLNSEEVLECHHITGAFNYLLKVTASSMEDLEQLISARIKVPGLSCRTETTIVFSSPKKDPFLDCIKVAAGND